MKRLANYILLWSFIGCFSMITASCGHKKEQPKVAPPVKVTVMEVGVTGNNESREYSGTVSSSESSTVSFSVAGSITDLYAKEGQKVSKGQLLGKVRNGEYLNAYNIAQAQLAEAQDGYDRLKKLHDANALPEVKWVEMEQKLKQAQNMAEMAKRTLNDANLYSPATGVVTKKFVEVGQNVLPVEPVYEIVSTTDITIDVSVSENEIGNFKVNELAYVTLEAAGLNKVEGKVSQKTVVADPLTRTFTVKVALSNKEGKILPGMIGNVTFVSEKNDSLKNDIILPSQAILLNADNQIFVWTVKDSIAQRQFVTADMMVSDGVIVKSGLKPGDKVVVAGMQKISSGTKVIPIEK